MPDDPSIAAPIAGTLRAEAMRQTSGYELPVYPFVAPAELRGKLGRHPVVIVGGGLTGLTAACDLALRGVPAVLVDEDDTVGVRGASSRGICYAQKSLEIFKRLGVYERIAAKGVRWSVGRTLAGHDEVYRFDLKTARTHDVSEQPPFINLQQFYLEWFLVDRIYELGTVELRWKSKVLALVPHRDHVELTIATPAGEYRLDAQWLIDCSGAHNPLRQMVGVAADTHQSIDRWCISDVRFNEQPPAERWTWIEAPFNNGRAVWQHLMADNVWRLDYQMPTDTDPEEISRPEVVAERLRRQFGTEVDFELVWVGAYSYRSQCLHAFRAGRIFFAGDAAHVMSPFGARGGNSGIQDADNLCWKLALVLQGRAPERLLDSYDAERRAAALENICITNRTTRFLSPETPLEHVFRAAVISLARETDFARALINTGRLSTPTCYSSSPLNIASRAGARRKRQRARHAGGPGNRPSGRPAGHAIQNVALTLPDGAACDLVALQQQAPDSVLCVLCMEVDAYFAQELERLEADYPVRFVCVRGVDGAASQFPTAIDFDDKLLVELGALGEPGTIRRAALVRPDLHLAGTLDDPGAADLERALRKVLAIEP